MPDSSNKSWQDKAISLLAIFITVMMGVLAGMGAYWQATVRMEARMSTAERQILDHERRLEQREEFAGVVLEKITGLEKGQSRITALLESHMQTDNNDFGRRGTK